MSTPTQEQYDAAILGIGVMGCITVASLILMWLFWHRMRTYQMLSREWEKAANEALEAMKRMNDRL